MIASYRIEDFECASVADVQRGYYNVWSGIRTWSGRFGNMKKGACSSEVDEIVEFLFFAVTATMEIYICHDYIISEMIRYVDEKFVRDRMSRSNVDCSDGDVDLVIV
jgi:hypothetical protein